MLKLKNLLLPGVLPGAIPPAKGEITAPGVAGPVTGIYNDIMIIAGGANFPDSMPWQGGKKDITSKAIFLRPRESISFR